MCLRVPSHIFYRNTHVLFFNMTSFPKKILIAFGSNQGEREEIFQNAVNEIHEKVGEVIKISTLYYTQPLNHPSSPNLEQGEFLNTVILVLSNLEPLDLLSKLNEIEEKFGRNRKDEVLWGPRYIDLDIICIEDLVFESENLKIPHSRMHERDFVLKPMNEVSPEWIHPELKKSVSDLLKDLNNSENSSSQ